MERISITIPKYKPIKNIALEIKKYLQNQGNSNNYKYSIFRSDVEGKNNPWMDTSFIQGSWADIYRTKKPLGLLRKRQQLLHITSLYDSDTITISSNIMKKDELENILLNSLNEEKIKDSLLQTK